MPVRPSVSTLSWGRERNSLTVMQQTEHKHSNTFFTSLPHYGVDSSMFEAQNGRDSTFDRYCKRVNEIFSKWSSRKKKNVSICSRKVSALPKTHKHRHTLSKCTECALTQREEQYSFPVPKYTPGKTLAQSVSILVEKKQTQRCPNKPLPRRYLLSLNPCMKVHMGAHSRTHCPHVEQ